MGLRGCNPFLDTAGKTEIISEYIPFLRPNIPLFHHSIIPLYLSREPTPSGVKSDLAVGGASGLAFLLIANYLEFESYCDGWSSTANMYRTAE